MKLWRHGGIKWVMLCLCKESSMCIWSVPKCTTNERAAWSSKLDNHDCVTTAPRKHGSDGYFATTWLQRKLGNWLSYVVCVTSPSTGCRGGLRVVTNGPVPTRVMRHMMHDADGGWSPGTRSAVRLLDREQVRHRCRIHDPSLGVLRILISTGPTVSRCRRCYSFSSREIDQFSRWISSVIQPFSANSKI